MRSFLLGAMVIIMSNQVAGAATVSPNEMAEARRWVAAKFEGVHVGKTRQSGLIVVANNGLVQPNARAGAPLNIAGVEYRRGLYCHAVSKVIVHLPGAGKAFSSTVGIDSHAGGGSVVFSVTVGSKERFRSKVLHCGDRGVPVQVALNGADELTLDVGDAGDGINCDQANWADAKVEMADGSTLWLGDMPFIADKPSYSTEPPFSFLYDGKPSADLLKSWEFKRSSRKLSGDLTERTLTWTDPATGLVVRCDGIEYLDFPTIEWTLHIKNTGAADTPILSEIRALDTRFECDAGHKFALNHHRGTTVSQSDFEPISTTLNPKDTLRFAPTGGRPLGTVFPYFNLQAGDEGTIIVVGWPGQWAAEFARDNARGLDVRAGQEKTHLKLHPGEEIRTPLIVLQFWQGDAAHAQNVWRRWMLAHNLPRPGGKLMESFLPVVSGNHFPGLLCNQTDEIRYVDRFLEEKIKPDALWMDAGWYVNKGSWSSTGTWEIDSNRFPGGLRAIADHVHARGIKLMVWFEPERVTPGSKLYTEHPEWLLGKDGGTKLLNLGNPQARGWLTDFVDRFMTEQGIDYYRQDFNMDPLAYWRANDAEDRQGITEINHITGYLAFWDELRRRRPEMLIDSCASGGHRNDLETMRRAVPLLRSDHILDPVGEQGHTYGLASWLPFTGTGFIDFDRYIFRSTMGPDTTLALDSRRKDLDWPLLRLLVSQWRELAPCYLGDYYPLSRYSLDADQWMAWQFDRPDLGRGVVQAFRRSESLYEAARYKLHGLDPGATYELRDLDHPRTRTATGRELMEQGLSVEIHEGPGAVVIAYRRAR